MAKTSKTMLNSSGESGFPCLVPDFRGNAFNFSPLRIMFAVGLSYIAFIMLSYVPSIPDFWRVFIINGCWNLSKAFSTPAEIIIQFLSFNLLMWCITLIDLWILKNPCIPGIKPTWSWCMIFLICCWILFARILLRILHLCSSVILACSFLFSWHLCLVLVPGRWWPHRMSLEIYLLLQFWWPLSKADCCSQWEWVSSNPLEQHADLSSRGHSASRLPKDFICNTVSSWFTTDWLCIKTATFFLSLQPSGLPQILNLWNLNNGMSQFLKMKRTKEKIKRKNK